MHRAVIDNYALEIVARAQATKARCREMISNDYASTAPRALAKAIANVSDFLQQAVVAIYKQIEWSGPAEKADQDLLLLKNSDYLIRLLFAHLRYVAGATTGQLPWSIVSAFEQLVASVLPDIQVMLRPQWHYNYSTSLTDLRDFYRNALQEYIDLVPDRDIETDVLASLKQPFHIISFPALERTNILLHSLLGHELGHLLSARYLSDEGRKTAFIESIRPDLVALAEQAFERRKDVFGPLFHEPIKQELLNTYAEEAGEIWTRALEELLSDVVGVILFGPAATLSTFEMAVSRGYDTIPSIANDYYPPWRMRLRTVVDFSKGLTARFFPVSANVFMSGDGAARAERLNTLVSTMEKLAADEHDLIQLKQSQLVALCYRDMSRYVAEGTTYLLENCGLKRLVLTPDGLYEKLPHLLERLEHGIPPNEVGHGLFNKTPPTMQEIINAAWYYRLSWRTDRFLDDGGTGGASVSILDDRRNVNLLTLKAIEYANLAVAYTSWRERDTVPRD